MRLQAQPGLRIIVRLSLPTVLHGPVTQAQQHRRLDHKGQTAVSDFLRVEFGDRRSTMGLTVRAMRAHDRVQACASGPEPSVGAAVVLPFNQTHVLRHGVAVVPGRSHRVLHGQPPRWEDGHLENLLRRGKKGEYGGIRVIV